ncbi:hypothetical protein HMPREF1705_04692 [Acetomicrobium hydrogeniformans ATCC BAA-1850]|uniref:Uncharacterized protein n=1 Tax=Acetomicrobium hydrogeniformans ATCC BAA-1850 TaxID=592015 RepID=A0A0T5XCK7_9BACT|nr:hypothetical protein HMPREF1705_04692 [Acetomicrobium hydrogeniformans ATCC BAA-1850]
MQGLKSTTRYKTSLKEPALNRYNIEFILYCSVTIILTIL